MTDAAAGGWRYGLLGLPLAFAALPLYVQLPAYYAGSFGVPLAALGALLLGARLLDALIDPWLGTAVDRLLARKAAALPMSAAGAAVVLALGFALLFLPPVRGTPALLAWAAVALVLSYAAFSALTIAHQAWGAMLGGDEARRARIVAWREGCALAGVLLASVLPLLAGWTATAAVLAAALALGVWAWNSTTAAAPRVHAAAAQPADRWFPFTQPAFRRLLAVFALNGIATAVPATLLLFFVQDRLRAPAALQPVFLGSYFLCAALSIPLWLRLVPRAGLARAWLAGMALALGVFAWAGALGDGDALAFAAVCALSGFALGSDLVLPGALLAGVIARAGRRGRGEGVFFGWWNLVSKLNLALAAGLALPLLSAAGYTPGDRAPHSLQALSIAYCLLPCVLKLAAAALLYFSMVRTGGVPCATRDEC
ncbi:MAG: MFS transporter [Pseudomonadota bacterium]